MNDLEHAMDLDIRLVSEYPACRDITNQLYQVITEGVRIRKENRAKETLKLVILNLWVSSKTGLPVKYSRNKSKYSVPERYGKLHIRYRLLMKIIGTLEDLGYIEQKIGFLDRSKNLGRETRMWPTAKMMVLFQDIEIGSPKVIHKSQPEEIIQLKDEDKILMDYEDRRSIRDMRLNLYRYNEFIGQQAFRVAAPNDVKINYWTLRKLQLGVLKGIVDFNRVETIIPANPWMPMKSIRRMDDTALVLAAAPQIRLLDEHNNKSNTGSEYQEFYRLCPNNKQLVEHIVDSSYRGISYQNIKFYEHIYTMTKYIRTYLVDITRLRLQILRKYPLSSFGLNGLDFNWNHPFLYRVFNQRSFKLGGRFFGSFHLEMPKTLRPYILINNEPTIEADYKALHIRMLYHLEGIHYDTDPYEDVAQGRDERSIYKLVLLIAINAETEKKRHPGHPETAPQRRHLRRTEGPGHQIPFGAVQIRSSPDCPLSKHRHRTAAPEPGLQDYRHYLEGADPQGYSLPACS